MGTSDYYKLLKIKRNATSAEVHAAYVRQAVQLQPDKNPNDRENAALRLQRISTAYEVLSDPEKRLEYDNSKEERLEEREPEVKRMDVEEVKEPEQVIEATPPTPVVENQHSSRSFNSNNVSHSSQPLQSCSRYSNSVSNSSQQSWGSFFGFSASSHSSSSTQRVTTSYGGTTNREVRVRTVNNVTTTEIYENGVLVSLKRTGEFSFL